jgi:hypothetical protein
MEKFGHATNFTILQDIVKGVDDGICQVSAFDQVEANQKGTPILHHVHVPFANHVITLFQSIPKHNHIMCYEHQ